MPSVCEICEWAIIGKDLNKVIFKTETETKEAFWVCNFCYRGLYGFRYSPKYLRKAADMLESFGDGGTFLERPTESRRVYKYRSRSRAKV